MDWIQPLGMIAGITLPLFNLPLMIRIWKRRSSKDISLVWVIGVYLCILLMIPSAMVSKDLVFRYFSIMNVILFTGVVYMVIYYRIRK